MSERDRLREHVEQQLWKDPLIGEGTLGKVFKVDGLNGEQLALKVSGFKDATQKEEEYLVQEVQHLASFNHPHIIAYIDGWEKLKDRQLRVFLLTEFASGGDVKTYLYRTLGESPSEAVFGTWLAQIASALDYIHDMNVVHRNLKPSNIMVFRDGSDTVLKIADFGMSKILDNPSAMAMSRVGTPYFMSPEILNGVLYNSKTDIWSLGCTAFEIATMTSLFTAKTLTTLISGVNRDEGARLVQQIKYGDFFKSLIRDMLQKDYKKRPEAKTVIRELLAEGYTTNCKHTNVSGAGPGSITDQGLPTASTSKGAKKPSSKGNVKTDTKTDSFNMTAGSMAVYSVANPSWGQIDQRNVKKGRSVSVAKSVQAPVISSHPSHRRTRTQSEGGHSSDMENVLARFTQNKKISDRLSKSGPVRSVSFDTSSSDTREDRDNVEESAILIRGKDEVLTQDIHSVDETAEDKRRLLSQIEATQSSLCQNLGLDLFRAAFSKLRIQEDEKMATELEDVLGDKFQTVGLQFVTLRLLESRFETDRTRRKESSSKKKI